MAWRGMTSGLLMGELSHVSYEHYWGRLACDLEYSCKIQHQLFNCYPLFQQFQLHDTNMVDFL